MLHNQKIQYLKSSIANSNKILFHPPEIEIMLNELIIYLFEIFHFLGNIM